MIAGIVIVSVAALALIIGSLVLLRRKRQLRAGIDQTERGEKNKDREELQPQLNIGQPVLSGVRAETSE
jgi:hypothetical protein